MCFLIWDKTLWIGQFLLITDYCFSPCASKLFYFFHKLLMELLQTKSLRSLFFSQLLTLMSIWTGRRVNGQLRRPTVSQEETEGVVGRCVCVCWVRGGGVKLEQRRYTGSVRTGCVSGHYLDERPLRGLGTVQRSRVLDIRAGNGTARPGAYQAVNKTRWGSSGRARCCLSLPHAAPLSRSRSGVNANLPSRFSLCRHHAAAQRHPPPLLFHAHTHFYRLKHSDSCVTALYGCIETTVQLQYSCITQGFFFFFTKEQ